MKDVQLFFSLARKSGRSELDDRLFQSIEEMAGFAADLLKLWYLAHEDELRAVIGGEYDAFHRMRLMYTLSESGTQFRCWYGVPGEVESPSHVDSGGEGLLYTITGAKDEVAAVVKQLTHEPWVDWHGAKCWLWQYRGN